MSTSCLLLWKFEFFPDRSVYRCIYPACFPEGASTRRARREKFRLELGERQERGFAKGRARALRDVSRKSAIVYRVSRTRDQDLNVIDATRSFRSFVSQKIANRIDCQTNETRFETKVPRISRKFYFDVLIECTSSVLIDFVFTRILQISPFRRPSRDGTRGTGRRANIWRTK